MVRCAEGEAVKPHIRLHCKQLRGIFAHDVLVWRVEDQSQPMIGRAWWSSPRAAFEKWRLDRRTDAAIASIFMPTFIEPGVTV